MKSTQTTTDLVTRYIDAWNESDTRANLIDEVFTSEATYTDPIFDVKGHVEIDGMIAGFHKAYPGLTFVLTSELEAHHNLTRFSWDIVDQNGTVHAKGTDVALISKDGKFAAVAGFFDQAPDL